MAVTPTQDGGLMVLWRLEAFFADSEPGEKVLIQVNGQLEATLDRDAVSYEIGKTHIDRIRDDGNRSLVIGVIFWWSDPVTPEEQSSLITIPLLDEGPPAEEEAQQPQGVIRPRNLRIDGYSNDYATVHWDSGQYYAKVLVRWGPKASRPTQLEFAGGTSMTPIGRIVPNVDYVLAVKGGVRRWLFGIGGYIYSGWTVLEWRSSLDIRSVRTVLAFRGAAPDGIRAAMGDETSVSRWITRGLS